MGHISGQLLLVREARVALPSPSTVCRDAVQPLRPSQNPIASATSSSERKVCTYLSCTDSPPGTSAIVTSSTFGAGLKSPSSKLCTSPLARNVGLPMSLAAEQDSSPLVTEVAERVRMRARNNREALLILNENMLSISLNERCGDDYLLAGEAY